MNSVGCPSPRPDITPTPLSYPPTQELVHVAKTGLACVMLIPSCTPGEGPLLGGTFMGSVERADAELLPVGTTTLCIRRGATLRWEAMRRAVRMREIVNFWLRVTSENTCAPGGAGRQRDLDEFSSDFLAAAAAPATPAPHSAGSDLKTSTDAARVLYSASSQFNLSQVCLSTPDSDTSLETGNDSHEVATAVSSPAPKRARLEAPLVSICMPDHSPHQPCGV